jgi:hypothetical protein
VYKIVLMLPAVIVQWSNTYLIKLMTIVNDDSRVVNKLEASFTDDARVVIYDHHMFIWFL